MERCVATLFAVVVLSCSLALSAIADESSPGADASLPSLDEARGRSELLHETMHATLQIVHHEYFREDEGVTIPAATLKRVFRELADRHNVELRWIAVDAQPMNVDHAAKDSFEKEAVRALAAGKESFELAENGAYRRAGAITLASDCLKCHLPNRTSTKSRTAALVIRMPIAGE
jgi:Protein of unknown function (DUF3365)